MLENIAESAIPYKYLFTGAQRFNQYSVLDTSSNTIGAFYKEANGLLDGKMILQNGDRGLTGYRRSMGPIEVVSFYDGETTVAQLTKANKTVDNLDKYLLHVIDGYEAWLPIMVFFVVYFDFIYHNNGGEIMVGTKIKYTYSFDKNIDKYDPNFILANFGQAEADRIAGKGPNSIIPPTTVAGMSMKTFWIVFGACLGVAILITLIVLSIVFL